jgi:hypothetical protein
MKTFNSILKNVVFKLLEYSLNSASKEQGLSKLKVDLKKIIPNLNGQYSSFKIDSGYLINKIRSQHAFQVSLAQNAISLLGDKKIKKPTLVDIGDSSGAHLLYLNALTKERGLRTISVNLDPIAIEKIKKKDLRQSNLELKNFIVIQILMVNQIFFYNMRW